MERPSALGSTGDDGVGINFQDLPSDFVVRTFTFVDDVRDVLALQSTCKRFCALGRSRLVWLARLQKELGIKLQDNVECDDIQLQNLYKTAVLNTKEYIRFWGVLTDGGCDNGWMHYWVDNLFVPNHWESYCSGSGSNINCFGILVDEELEIDKQSAAKRDYMIQKCRYPAAQLFNGQINGRAINAAYSLLQCWSTPELEHFVLPLYHDLQNGGALGACLEMGLQGEELQKERERMRAFVQQLEQQSCVESGGILRGGFDGTLQNVMFDTACTKRLKSATQCKEMVLGVIDRVMVSRRGSFSCPVLFGAVFIGNISQVHQFDCHEDVMRHLQACSQYPECRALDGITDSYSVECASEEGLLPPIAASGSSFAGEWIEFSVNATENASLVPLVWFHFYTKQEADNIRASQANSSEGLHDADDLIHSGASSSVNSEEEGLAEDVAEALFEGNHLGDVDSRRTTGRERLEVELTRKVAGNIVCVKLIDQEDLMTEWGDDHEAPNIDINCVAFGGTRVHLPQGTWLKP